MNRRSDAMGKILFFGIFDPGYSRNAILLGGLRKLGCQVDECRVPSRSGRLGKYLSLIKQAWPLRRRGYDAVVVAYPGHTVVWIAKLLFRRRIFFDAFVSLYLSNVEDRKVHGRHSLGAVKDYLLDSVGCRLADRVILDTALQAGYFVEKFRLDTHKVFDVPVGGLEGEFFPRPKETAGKIKVHFHGSFIPLHGIGVILRAAKLLEAEKSLEFALIGRGQLHAEMVRMAQDLGLANVSFLEPVPYLSDGGSPLADRINDSDICLGIFDGGIKANMVVPNKLFEYAACGKPVITARTDAVVSLFKEGEDLLLVPADDPSALADGIRALKDDILLRRKIGDNLRNKFLACFTSERVAERLLGSIETYAEHG